MGEPARSRRRSCGLPSCTLRVYAGTSHPGRSLLPRPRDTDGVGRVGNILHQARGAPPGLEQNNPAEQRHFPRDSLLALRPMGDAGERTLCRLAFEEKIRSSRAARLARVAKAFLSRGKIVEILIAR